MGHAEPILQAHDLHKTYRVGEGALHVLRGVSLSVERGQWVSVVGRSGSGKSTLLHLLGGLDVADSGEVMFERLRVTSLGRGKVDQYRAKEVGFVFQFYHLLPELNALENVMVAGMVRHGVFGWAGQKSAMRQRAMALLESVGLKDRIKHKPAKLSGGERQRVAIARALMNEPALLLADEPTGNLDSKTSSEIVSLLGQLHEQGQTIVMVTHDDGVAQEADVAMTLVEGVLVGEDESESASG